MQLFRGNLGNALGGAATLFALGLTGCSNSCFVAVFNNGSGTILVKAGDPPPACSLAQAKGAIRAVALKSPICQSCTAAARIEHVFVTVRSIQLHNAIADPNSSDWLEIAPQLADEPKQVDLMGKSAPETLAEEAIVPAGSYAEVRLRFYPNSPASLEGLQVRNACGETRWNCVVLADGRVEPLRLTGEMPELLISAQGKDGEALVVLPEGKVDLLLRLEPRRVWSISSTEGLKPQNVLAGLADVIRR